MDTIFSDKMILYLFLCALLISSQTDAATNGTGRHCGQSEKLLLDALNLKEDVDDAQIIKLLDEPSNRIYAAALIRYRKIISATPKLLEIVDSNDVSPFAKMRAAAALCDFGNRQWINPIKSMLENPKYKGRKIVPLRMKVAGLLARAEDYSQYDVIAENITSDKYHIRYTAITNLRNFGHESETVTDSAVGLLQSVAISDENPWLREVAIISLEKLAKKKPAVIFNVIEVLKANVGSTDYNLRTICKGKLKSYGE